MKISSLIITLFFVGLSYSQNLDSLKNEYHYFKSVYNFSKAKKLLHDIKEEDTTNWFFLEEISLAELSGNYEEAINVIVSDSSYAESTIGLIRLADNYMNNREYVMAVDTYLRIDTIYYNYYLYEKAGDAFYGKAEVSLAIEYYDTSIKRGNVSANIYVKLSRLYIQLSKYSDALDLLEAAVIVHPKNVKLLKLYTEVLFTNKDYLNTVNCGLRVIDMGDTTYSITQKLGLAYYFIAVENVSRETKIKYFESLKYLILSSEIDETDPLNYFYIGMNYSSMEKYDSAAFYFNKSIDSFYPSYTADVYIQLASVLQKDGDYSNAIRNYRKAMNFDNDRKNILFYLATVYDKYYSDKYPAKNTYEHFIRNNESSDKKLLEYASQRIESLIEEIHFRK